MKQTNMSVSVINRPVQLLAKKNNFNKPLVLMMTNLLKPLLSKSETIPIQIQQYDTIPSEWGIVGFHIFHSFFLK